MSRLFGISDLRSEPLKSQWNVWSLVTICGIILESLEFYLSPWNPQFLEFLESYWNLWNIIRNSWISSKSLKYVESLESCMDSWLNLPEIQTSLETSVKKNQVIYPSLLPWEDIGEWDLLVGTLKNTQFTQKFDMTFYQATRQNVLA